MRWIAAMLGLALATAACATTLFEPPTEATLAAQQRMLTTRAVLVARGGAAALFTAAALPWLAMPDDDSMAQRLELLTRAYRLAGENAIIAAQGMAYCRSVPGCNVEVWRQRLQDAAPRDAGYLVPTLKAALDADDEGAETHVLHEMASLETFDDHWLATRALVSRGLADVPLAALADAPPDMSADAARSVLVAAINSGTTMIGNLNTVAQACNPDRAGAAFAARRRACGEIGGMLQHASSITSNMIGLRLSEWAATRDADRRAIQVQRCRVRWQMEGYYAGIDLHDPLAAARAFAALRAAQTTAGSEIGGIRVELERLGLPLEPAPGWTPYQEATAAPAREADHGAVARTYSCARSNTAR